MILKFLLWLKTSFEDNNGRASGARLTAFIMTLLVIFLVFQATMREKAVEKWMFEALLIFIAAAFGIIYTPKVFGREEGPTHKMTEETKTKTEITVSEK